MVFFVLNWNRELFAFLSYQALLKLALKRKERNNILPLPASNFRQKMMSCVKLMFESFLVLMLFSYDWNWPEKEKNFLIYFVSITWEIIFDTKDFWVVLTRCCVRITHCLSKTLHFSKKATVQPSILIHCLSRETVGSKDFNNCKKINKYRRTF